MARHKKAGLDYYPHDIDMSADPKVEYLEAVHGIVGYAVLNKLLERIYRNGYFTPWTEKDEILFARKIGITGEQLHKVIETCIEEELFDRRLFADHHILTSLGVQKRFALITQRRSETGIDERFNLLQESPLSGDFGSRNDGSEDIPAAEMGISAAEIPQRKEGKEGSKGKEERSVKRGEAATADELLKTDFVLRLHNGEFDAFALKVKKLCAEHRFTWTPTTGSIESDLRCLVYKTSDDRKLQILGNLLNVYQERSNWAEYIFDAVRHTIATSRKVRITHPYRFIVGCILDRPMEIISSKSDGLLSHGLGVIAGARAKP